MKRLDFIKKIGLAGMGLPLLSSFELSKEHLFVADQKEREKLDLNLYKEMEGKNYIIKPNGNIIYSLGPDFYYEYTSKYPYYQIVRTFYPNNLLKDKSYCLDLVNFWKTLHYDEKGKLAVIDEDKKFGKIKIDFILKFMEKKGLINLKTGKGGFDFKSGNTSVPLKIQNVLLNI